MNLQFYTSAAAYLTDGKLDEAAFKINAVRLEILGSFGKDFSYHFHQSYNKYSNPHGLTKRARAFGAEDYSSQRISLGLVYTIPVF